MSKNSTKSLLRNEEGNVVIWVAGSMTMIMGFAALAVDLGHLYALDNQLQNAADAAALAAVSQLNDPNEARSVAAAITAQNLPPEEHGTALASSDVELGQWNPNTRVFAAGVNPPDAVRVTVRRTSDSGNAAPTFFGKVLGKDEVDIVAQSIAAPPSSPACLLALEPVEKEAISVNSNSSITANGCKLQANSSNAEAVMTNAGSSVTADAIDINGDYTGPESSYTPQPTIDVPPSPDPLAGLPAPPEAGDTCDHTSETIDADPNYTMTPGVYCNDFILNAGTNATMEPGIYVFRDGDFIVNSGASITGDDVMIYLTGINSPELVLNSDSHADLSGLRTGPHAGILIFQDPNVADGTVHLFNSDATSSFEGTIYLPNGKMKINSGTTMSGDAAYSYIIARSFEINSDSGIVLNSDYAASDVPLPAGLVAHNTRLVM